MRGLVLALLILLAGCASPGGPASTHLPQTEFSDPTTTLAPVGACQGSAEAGSAGPSFEFIVAHRDGVARYRSNGSEEATPPLHEAPLDFAEGMGYRWVDDGSAVYDHHGIHRLSQNLTRAAWWSSANFGGAIHVADRYYAMARGKLYVLTEELVAEHSEVVPAWSAPPEPRYDAMVADGSTLLVGTAGRPDALLAYSIESPAEPRLLREIALDPPTLPVEGPGPQSPQVDTWFAYILVQPGRVLLARDGTYRTGPDASPNRFQDLVTVDRTTWTVERVEPQYREDEPGMTHGARIGPVDPAGRWAFLQVRGAYSLARMETQGPRWVPACQIDVRMSTFSPEDVFLRREGDRLLWGSHTRVEGWSVADGRADRLGEVRLTKPATDVLWATR